MKESRYYTLKSCGQPAIRPNRRGMSGSVIVGGRAVVPSVPWPLLLALANMRFCFRTGNGVVLESPCFPSPGVPSPPPLVIHGPVPIITLEPLPTNRATPARLYRGHTPEDTAGPERRCQPKVRSRPPTSKSASSVSTSLHDYTAPAALLRRVGILSFGYWAPDVGHHVVPGAVAVGDNAAGPS